MHMTYWFGVDLGTFMFPGYNVTTTWGLIATCLGLGSLAIIFEGMKIIQIKLRQRTLASLPSEQGGLSGEDSSLLSRLSRKTFVPSAFPYCQSWISWFLEVLHWFTHTTLGYLLMLAVMSYNAYFTIALAIGGGLGFWIFGAAIQQLNMLQFTDKRRTIQCDSECSDAITNTERRPSTMSVDEDQLARETTVEVHT
ncbi:probable low affinity copper uptake protein 2 [Athalia rosae]|uniref:probable low affinity copper uptake protein 2 n=1 Tax=Athalia rosae TaxID=37344 RepID=UPI0006266982|nr:probable low affinity copper uptake protein 2 [Athalia rosae]XP_048505729.1 probable low affinity copper uptake protein 2 [Athalia rosae]